MLYTRVSSSAVFFSGDAVWVLFMSENTPGRQQSKTLLTIDKRGSKIDRNSVFRLPFVASRATNGNQKLSF